MQKQLKNFRFNGMHLSEIIIVPNFNDKNRHYKN